MDSSKRDVRFDNLKGIMIFLVVFCHSVEKLSPQWAQEYAVQWLYSFIYSFHMPVFIFISGYFSKNPQGNTVQKAVTGCLVPYAVFQVIYGLLFFTPRTSLTESLLSVFNLAVPQWTMWYLLSLFFWKILAGSMSVFRWPLAVSILLSVYIGATKADTFFSLARTFAFFPYFMSGYLLSPRVYEKLRSCSRLRYAGSFSAAAVLFSLLDLSGSKIGYLRMSKPFSALPLPIWEAMLLRLVLLLIGFGFTVSFIAFVGDQKTMLSMLGTNCMSVYLLHSGVLRILSGSGLITLSGPLVTILGAAVVSSMICFLCGNRIVHRALQMFLRFICCFLVRTE